MAEAVSPAREARGEGRGRPAAQCGPLNTAPASPARFALIPPILYDTPSGSTRDGSSRGNGNFNPKAALTLNSRWVLPNSVCRAANTYAPFKRASTTRKRILHLSLLEKPNGILVEFVKLARLASPCALPTPQCRSTPSSSAARLISQAVKYAIPAPVYSLCTR